LRELIRELKLEPHPEGGWYREIYRSPTIVHTPRGERSAITTIHYPLLPASSAAGTLLTRMRSGTSLAASRSNSSLTFLHLGNSSAMNFLARENKWPLCQPAFGRRRGRSARIH
jgi:hypothetical protein